MQRMIVFFKNRTDKGIEASPEQEKKLRRLQLSTERNIRRDKREIVEWFRGLISSQIDALLQV